MNPTKHKTITEINHIFLLDRRRESEMEFLRPLNILLAVVILLCSASCVYSAPVERSAGPGCGDQVLSPDTNAQSTFYDALYVARKLVVSL